MKISPYIIYLEMQPNALLLRQNFIIRKKWVSHATSMMVPRAPPAVVPPPVFRPDWKTLASVSFVAQPTNRSLFGFEAQTKKPSR
jgi:hypothetical protein